MEYITKNHKNSPQVSHFSKKWPQIGRKIAILAKNGYPNFKVKTNRTTLFELCKCWEADFWYVASLWGELKIWCGNFPNFDFSGPKLHYVRFKIAILAFLKIYGFLTDFFAHFYIGKYKGKAETWKYPPNSRNSPFFDTASVFNSVKSVELTTKSTFIWRQLV